MSLDTQASLFGEGGMTPPALATLVDPQAVRNRLNHLLNTLSAASTMPLLARDLRMWQAVVPNMSRWLPEAEAQAVRSTFERELQRLGATAAQT